MTKRNPFRVAEKVGEVIAKAIFFGFAAASLSVVAYVFVSQVGWWSLLVIPAVLVGLFLLVLIGAGVSSLGNWIRRKWQQAKYEWEYRAIEEEESK